jgi:hypothetical protein
LSKFKDYFFRWFNIVFYTFLAFSSLLLSFRFVLSFFITF